MTRPILRALATLSAAALLGGAVWLSGALHHDEDEAVAQKPKKPAKAKLAQKPGPVVMDDKLVSLEITLGIKDKQQTEWAGEIVLSEGKVAGLELLEGGVKSKIDGARFTVLHRRQQMNVLPPMLRASLDSPLSASVTLKTGQGEIAFKLSELPPDGPKLFLDGQVSIERLESALRLTGSATEDDFPAMARAPDGTIWLAYVEYTPGPPIIPERLQAGEFDTLVPKGHGDKIRLRRFDGKTWHEPIDVTEGGLDVWRPTVAVSAKGDLVVTWSERKADKPLLRWWRRFSDGQSWGAGELSAGSVYDVVSAADARGNVWIAWQEWNKDHFDILLLGMREEKGTVRVVGPRRISKSNANNWSPAIAADSKGNVYVAWDTYDKGNYDVHLHVAGSRDYVVADSPRFEARPSLVCDAQDRLWIAYEEGDEQWGKDFSTAQFKRIPLEKNPGFGLYNNRTVRVKCLVDGKLTEPAGDIEAAFADRLLRNKSHPRLAVDKAGGVWLLVRHHPLATGAGENWNSYATRYDGKQWSPARRLASSANLLDNRPALVPFGDGVLAVYSSDNRLRTANRDQNDLHASVLTPAGPTYPPELVPPRPVKQQDLTAVHPNELSDVARMRQYVIEAGGKKLHLFRGEFHRHTEYTAHRDGDGSLEDSWRYALDAGRLDWMGNGDHLNGYGHEYMWWQVQKVTDLMHNPPHFVAAHTYERSLRYPNGHRNVILPRRGIRPLPAGDAAAIEGTPEKGALDTKRLYAYLKHFGGICASHTSATDMGTDWRDNDPLFEPIVEIYQGHRHNYEEPKAPRSPTKETHIGGFQPDGFVWNAFDKRPALRLPGFERPRQHAHELRRRPGREQLKTSHDRRLQAPPLLRRHRQHHPRRSLRRPPDG